jgi:GR25 family glycosyltransferase involved in LPS biosynthesis
VYSSQFTVLQQFLDRNSSDFVLVLEDDVIFDINFPLEAFSAYCAERNIDYIRLFGKHFAGAIWLGFFFDRSIIRYRTSPAGAQAYLMSKQGAKLFTEHFQLIDATVDLAMDRFWESQLPIYSIFPYPIIERYSPTSIPIPSTHEALGAEDRFAWNCHRALGKAKKIYANITLRTVDARMKQKSPEFRQVFDSA